MKKKKVIEFILIVLVIIGLIISFILITKKEPENKIIVSDLDKKIEAILKNEVKDEKLFDYSDPKKQKDGTYRIDVERKSDKTVNAYYKIDIKKNTYQLIAMRKAVACPDKKCGTERQN